MNQDDNFQFKLINPSPEKGLLFKLKRNIGIGIGASPTPLTLKFPMIILPRPLSKTILGQEITWSKLITKIRYLRANQMENNGAHEGHVGLFIRSGQLFFLFSSLFNWVNLMSKAKKNKSGAKWRDHFTFLKQDTVSNSWLFAQRWIHHLVWVPFIMMPSSASFAGRKKAHKNKLGHHTRLSSIIYHLSATISQWLFGKYWPLNRSNKMQAKFTVQIDSFHKINKIKNCMVENKEYLGLMAIYDFWR